MNPFQSGGPKSPKNYNSKEAMREDIERELEGSLSDDGHSIKDPTLRKTLDDPYRINQCVSALLTAYVSRDNHVFETAPSIDKITISGVVDPYQIENMLGLIYPRKTVRINYKSGESFIYDEDQEGFFRVYLLKQGAILSQESSGDDTYVGLGWCKPSDLILDAASEPCSFNNYMSGRVRPRGINLSMYAFWGMIGKEARDSLLRVYEKLAAAKKEIAWAGKNPSYDGDHYVAENKAHRSKYIREEDEADAELQEIIDSFTPAQKEAYYISRFDSDGYSNTEQVIPERVFVGLLTEEQKNAYLAMSEETRSSVLNSLPNYLSNIGKYGHLYEDVNPTIPEIYDRAYAGLAEWQKNIYKALPPDETPNIHNVQEFLVRPVVGNMAIDKVEGQTGSGRHISFDNTTGDFVANLGGSRAFAVQVLTQIARKPGDDFRPWNLAVNDERLSHITEAVEAISPRIEIVVKE